MVRYQLDHDSDVVDENTDYINQNMTEIATTVSDDYDDDILMEDVAGGPPGDHGEDEDYNSGLGEEEDKGEQTDCLHSTSRALSNYTGNALDRPPGTTIQENHYHIYYTPPPEYYDDGPSSSCCGRWICRIVTSWWFVAIMALSFQVVYNYGPPVAPPRQSVASAGGTAEIVLWKEFWDNQLDAVKNLIKTWGHELPVHVSSWCWQGLRDDLLTQFNREHLIQPNPLDENGGEQSHSLNHCMWESQLFRPHASGTNKGLMLHRNRLKETLLASVFGQDLAVDMIDQTITSRRNLRSVSPILLYLTGASYVGKTHLAKALSLALFNPQSKIHDGNIKCKFDQIGDNRSPILTLHSKDISKADNGEKSIDQILKHIQITSPIFGGSAVIITHVEELPPGVVNKIISRLASSVGLADSASSATADYPNLLVVFTSNVASRVIQKSIQRYGGVDHIPSLELQAFLSHHVDTFHAGQRAEQNDLLPSLGEENPIATKPLSAVSIRVSNLDNFAFEYRKLYRIGSTVSPSYNFFVRLFVLCFSFWMSLCPFSPLANRS